MKLPYVPGTRYSNSLTYDVATTEVVHGFQVFEQRREDGTPTGRKGFVNHRGSLCSLSVADLMRREAQKEALPDLLAALERIEAGSTALLRHAQAVLGVGSEAAISAAVLASTAAAALERAMGVRP